MIFKLRDPKLTEINNNKRGQKYIKNRDTPFKKTHLIKFYNNYSHFIYLVSSKFNEKNTVKLSL
jgi:hypothetical protein